MGDVLVLNGSPDEGDDRRERDAWNAEVFDSLTEPLGALSIDAVTREMRHNLGIAGVTQQISFENYRTATGEDPTP